MRTSQANLKRALPLPHAARAILHLEGGAHQEPLSLSAFDELITQETAIRASDAKNAYPYLLCGPHTQAKQARADIKSKIGVESKKPTVAYTSRTHGVGCWSASLTERDAGALAASPAFSSITPVPASSKFAPNLFVAAGAKLVVKTTSVFHASGAPPAAGADGYPQKRTSALRLKLSGGHGTAESRAALAASWASQSFGFGAGQHADSKAGDSAPVTPKFHASRVAAASADCAARLAPTVFTGSRDAATAGADAAVYVSFAQLDSNEAKSKKPSMDCAVAALAFLASQPEVLRIDAPTPVVSKSDVHMLRGASKKPMRKAMLKKVNLPRTSAQDTMHHVDAAAFAAAKTAAKTAEKNAKKTAAKTAAKTPAKIAAKPPPPRQPARNLNSVAAGAIQSGSLGSTPLWDAGVDGAGQFVQVTDTGFDDASCFLRSGTAQSFTQVARSVYSNPVTDASLRKVVQYVSHDAGVAAFGFDDDVGGHGSHCAGTVAGSIGSDDPFAAVALADASLCQYYDDEDGYLSYYCEQIFCATCGDRAGKCNNLCGFGPDAFHYMDATGDADFSGMAPGAKLMVYDGGGDEEGLYFPSKDDLLGPAYAQGARVSSHSWGGSDNDYSGGGDFDQFIYDHDDALVLIAAGNDGSLGGGSVMDPATFKNGLSVGASETGEAPDTVASFSSKGPTNDMRIKPDLVAPGNPILSCSASGFLEMPTCSVTEMSGTSMATPATAGTAALVRQYLVDGFHARHSPAAHAASDYDAVSPSAALLKAMLIGSAAPMTHGYSADGGLVTLGEFYGPPAADGGQGSAQGDLWQFPVVDPDAITYGDDQVGDVQCDDQDYVGYSFTCMCHATCASCGAWHADPSDCHTCIDGLDHKVVYVDGTGTCAATVEGDYIAEPFTLGAYGVDYTQGFGHVRTSNVLPLDSSFDLFLFERSLAAHSSETMTYTVTSAATQVDVTLVWTDPPAEEGCDKLGAGGCLIHDLDLKVTLNGGRVYANFGAGSSGTYGGQEDEYNNVEKVSISALTLAAGDELSVMVLSNGLAYADTQKYAVAVTGHLEASDGPGGSNGNCFDGTSVVSVQDAVTRAAMPTPVSRLKVHDKVLAVDANHKATWAAVSSLPHSYSAADFVDITMDAAKDSPGSSSKSMPGALGNRLSVTEHHTFPSCHDARKMVAASELKPGSCLRTLQGGTQVVKAATRRLASPSDVTYTVELEGSVDMLVVGGVVTHAKPNTAAHRSAQNSKAKKKGAEAVLNIQQAGKRMKTNMAALLSEKSN